MLYLLACVQFTPAWPSLVPQGVLRVPTSKCVPCRAAYKNMTLLPSILFTLVSGNMETKV